MNTFYFEIDGDKYILTTNACFIDVDSAFEEVKNDRIENELVDIVDVVNRLQSHSYGFKASYNDFYATFQHTN